MEGGGGVGLKAKTRKNLQKSVCTNVKYGSYLFLDLLTDILCQVYTIPYIQKKKIPPYNQFSCDTTHLYLLYELTLK